MTDGVVLLVAGALLLISAPLLQWQLVQASERLAPDWDVARRLALFGVLCAVALGVAVVTGGVIEVA